MTDSAKIIELLDKIGDKIIEQKEFLTELDKPIGEEEKIYIRDVKAS